MMAPDRNEVESLFEAALEIAPERRHDFVTASCSNEAMRAAVLSLLAAHARADGVLETSPRSLLGERVPERLGSYRVLREIGRGGMGAVYDAERDDGQFRRRVAIKILRQDSDPELVQRILHERQILAGLDHPNIARLLDGGVTPDGRPYLVMEHVEGLPVDVYCERMRLTVAERLELFTRMARAVDFAHRNLVVHRDLKPSNILVTADGRVKLLDFGVAKLLQPWVVSDAPITRERRALTLEYASPEQLRGESLTTTTDVYSLGVVLYELLTGSRPHREHEGSMAAHTAAVCEGAVQRPSARVLADEPQPRHGGGDAAGTGPVALAHARQTTPQRLAKQLRGDVDAIVEMALRPEPPRRYPSAEALAQDIDRHLTHRPVRAQVGTRGYALGKLIRRHRLTAAALAVTLTAVLLGAGTAAWQARIADRERQSAEQARADAEQVANFLIELFDGGDQPPVTVTVHDLMSRGAGRIDQLANQPDVQARVLGAMGAIHERIGAYEEGQRATERALAMLSARGGAGTAEAARLNVQLGVLLRRRGEYDSAQAAFFRARDIQERVLAPSDPELSITLQNLAGIAIYLGDFAEAEQRARAALDLQLRTLGETHRARVNMLTQLGTIQRARGNRDAAERTLRQAVALRPRATGSTRREVLNDRFQLATLLMQDPVRVAEAEAMFRAELPSLDEADPQDLPFISWAENMIAEAVEERGAYDESERLRRHVLELRRGMLGAEHPATAESALLLGSTLLARGRPEEALEQISAAADVRRRTLGERHPVYAAALMSLGDVLARTGRLQEADSVFGLAAMIRADRYGQQNHGYIDALRQRALVQVRMTRFAVAEALLNDALRLAVEARAAATARSVHAAFASLYDAWGRPADASRHRAEAGRIPPP